MFFWKKKQMFWSDCDLKKTWVQKTVLKVDFWFFHSDFKVQDTVLKHDFGFSNLRVQVQ